MLFAKKPRGCKQTKIAIHRKATAVNFILVSVDSFSLKLLGLRGLNTLENTCRSMVIYC
jgi:hypothetical protein